MSTRIPDSLTKWSGPLEENLAEGINKYMMLKTQEMAGIAQKAEQARQDYQQLMSEEINEQAE